MFRQHHLSMLIATAVVLAPTFLANPASAQSRVYVVTERAEDVPPPPRYNRNWNREQRAEDVSPPSRYNYNWDRDDKPKPRIVKLRNRDIRLPNEDIISARKVRRLPNGDIRLPNGDIVEIDD